MWTRQLDYFEVEVTTFKPDPITESLRGQYPADCDWFRSLLEPDPVVLDVSAVQETGYNPKSRTRDVDWGKLIIFFNNGQAYTRLLEHSGWCLRDPIRAQQATGSAEFLDETGESFFVSLRNAITRVQSLAFTRLLAIHQREINRVGKSARTGLERWPVAACKLRKTANKLLKASKQGQRRR